MPSPQATAPGSVSVPGFRPPLPSVPGYEILEELGRGGMGVVYKARQAALGRIVALKMIRSGAFAGELELARFRTEAAALAQLQHPNIVQVFEYGVHEETPYVALEYVPGGNLADYLNGSPLTPRAAAELTATLARAIAAAHDRRIIHRDLKPANILFQIAEGRLPNKIVDPAPAGPSVISNMQSAIPKIADFGLAKVLDSEIEQTASGTVMGTPAYMAPEQAAGHVHDLGPATDVHALGVILYEMLVGRPPFNAATVFDTLYLVRFQDAAPPRRLQPTTPNDLETICLKCLHKESARRYPHARELADDLDRYLQGEPISARPVSPLERAVKWARRRPATAALVALLPLIPLGLAGGLIWQQRQNALLAAEKEAAEVARDSARREQAAAEVARNRTREVLDIMTGELAEQWLGGQSQLTEPQKRFLRQAVNYFQETTGRQAASEADQLRLGRELGQLANLQRLLGEYAAADAAYQKALTTFTALAARFPLQPQYPEAAAEAHQQIGVLSMTLGRGDDAAKHFQEALTLSEALLRGQPGAPSHRVRIGQSHVNLGNSHVVAGRVQEALRHFNAALSEYEVLLRDHPGDLEYQHKRGQALINSGYLLHQIGQAPEAVRRLKTAVGDYHAVIAAHPDVPKYRQELGTALTNLGSALLAAGQVEEGGKYRIAAVEEYEALVRNQPAVPQYRQELARALLNLGIIEKTRGQMDEAIRRYQTALAEYENLHRAYPKIPAYRRELAGVHNNLGNLYMDLRRFDDAARHFQASLHHKETLVREQPDVPDYAADLGLGQFSIARLKETTGAVQDALEWYGKAVATLKEVVGRSPRLVAARAWLSAAYHGLAAAQGRLDRHADAAKAWAGAAEYDAGGQRPFFRRQHARSLVRAGNTAEAVAEAGELAKANDANADALYELAATYALASAAGDQSHHRLSEEYAARAVELLRQALAKGFNDVQRLKMDDDLKSLRGRPDFLKLSSGQRDADEPMASVRPGLRESMPRGTAVTSHDGARTVDRVARNTSCSTPKHHFLTQPVLPFGEL
jgi:serine/threonine-protein kinase